MHNQTHKIGRFRFVAGVVMTVVVGVLVSSCSINQLAVNVLADTLAGDGGGSVFTSDDDPELVGDALPFALKLYEIILSQSPDHDSLLFSTGSGFISYANAFVATPATMFPNSQWREKEAADIRAKNLYLRGREHLLQGLEVRHPGFRTALANNDFAEYMAEMTADDVPFLYWAAAGWVAAFGLNAFDLELGFTVPQALVLAERALELDESYGQGTIHDLLVQYHASIPANMGGDATRVDYHHQRALEISGGTLAGQFITYAEAVVIKQQNADLFTELMEKALAIDPGDYTDSRLVNVLAQRKATWYLEHIGEFFLLDLEEYED